MKIDIRDIVSAHIRTLVNARTSRISFSDIIVFYILPVCFAVLIALDREQFPSTFYGMAISVFAIFAALLFSVQIALFSILQRDVAKSGPILEDKKRRVIIEEQTRNRRGLIREVNANISYLILVACLGVAMLLAFTLTPHLAVSRAAISSCLLSHFVLTVLLVVVRVHTLFDEEYRRE